VSVLSAVRRVTVCGSRSLTAVSHKQIASCDCQAYTSIAKASADAIAVGSELSSEFLFLNSAVDAWYRVNRKYRK